VYKLADKDTWIEKGVGNLFPSGYKLEQNIAAQHGAALVPAARPASAHYDQRNSDKRLHDIFTLAKVPDSFFLSQ
jgi:hypothetical protein